MRREATGVVVMEGFMSFASFASLEVSVEDADVRPSPPAALTPPTCALSERSPADINEHLLV